MSEQSLQYVFAAVLLVFVVSGLGLRRAGSRRATLLLGLAPFAAWLAYEILVHRVMPYADIRIDWLLLLPIALVHGRNAVARFRRLD